MMVALAAPLVYDSWRKSNSAETTALTNCQATWSKCVDNEDMVNHYENWRNAQSQCKKAAIAAAKYGVPEFGWSPFSTFLTGSSYVTSGVALLFDDRAKFQNIFGAMAHVRVRCEYDLREKKVTEIKINMKD
jgi:hypothetical protein